jgi:hypothetical protein
MKSREERQKSKSEKRNEEQFGESPTEGDADARKGRKVANPFVLQMMSR